MLVQCKLFKYEISLLNLKPFRCTRNQESDFFFLLLNGYFESTLINARGEGHFGYIKNVFQ